MLTEDVLKNMFYQIIGDYTQSPTGNKAYIGVISTISGANYIEPTDSSYERSEVGARYSSRVDGWSFTYGTSDDGTKAILTATNVQEIHLPETTQAWDTIKYFGIYSSKTGGTPRYWGTLKTSITPAAKTVVVMKKGALVVTIEG